MSGDTPTYSYFRGDEEPEFATETEYEAARILDYYRVPWEYEPRTFILKQDPNGDIKEAFAPDFYLPELDLYIEVTQMKQSLVTRKNRKVRKLREKYPGSTSRSSTGGISCSWPRNTTWTHPARDREILRLIPEDKSDDRSRLTNDRAHAQSQAGTNSDPLIDATFLEEEEIQAKVSEMGRLITRDYDGKKLLLLSILKGAVYFMTDLARSIDLPLAMVFLAISSYQEDQGKTGSRAVRFLKDADAPMEGKDVLIVEDIIDTGLTLHYIRRNLSLRPPRSLEVCPLLDRPHRRLVDIPVRYKGFTVPDAFFVGYGFDHRQRYRNLPYLAYVHAYAAAVPRAPKNEAVHVEELRFRSLLS